MSLNRSQVMPNPPRWFSGYISVTPDLPTLDTINSHYIYVEREAGPDHPPGPAPIMLWSNGGPGASSMFGLMTELGPFMLSDASLATDDFKKTGIPTLMRNPNLLIISGPPPVGFSWCGPEGPKGDGLSCGNWTDERMTEGTFQAQVTFQALVGFFEKHPALRKRPLFLHPALKKRPLFLIGESYAGVYIPSLARRILQSRKLIHDGVCDGSDASLVSALRGFAVGDACVGTRPHEP
ncbi:Alpha/Beta hydrolase protein [Baffinella frigidus]|nr:Alpha/Beta hydrolase protein [Cryptophyta sp. CCMP2293]